MTTVSINLLLAAESLSARVENQGCVEKFKDCFCTKEIFNEI